MVAKESLSPNSDSYSNQRRKLYPNKDADEILRRGEWQPYAGLRINNGKWKSYYYDRDDGERELVSYTFREAAAIEEHQKLVTEKLLEDLYKQFKPLPQLNEDQKKENEPRYRDPVQRPIKQEILKGEHGLFGNENENERDLNLKLKRGTFYPDGSWNLDPYERKRLGDTYDPDYNYVTDMKINWDVWTLDGPDNLLLTEDYYHAEELECLCCGTVCRLNGPPDDDDGSDEYKETRRYV